MLTDAWPVGDETYLRRHLERLRADPEIAGWITRTVTLHDGTLVGRAGFHGPPDESGKTGFGYELDERFRGRGYASEAARALVRWGYATGRLRTVVALVEPANAASIRVLERLRFSRTGAVTDEEHGTRDRFELRRDRVPRP